MNENTKVGCMLSEVPFSNIPIIFKNCGMDFFIIDTEHGSFDYSALSNIIMNANLTSLPAIMRLSGNSRTDITRFMDMGAKGVLLPMTNTKEDILQVVNYAKYAPLGKRGISTTRMHTMYNPGNLAEYMEHANQITKIFAQIETVEGVKNSYDIANTDGVEGLIIGPNDLACDLGCMGSDKEPVLESIRTVAENCNKLGKPFGIITNNHDYISLCKQLGAAYFCYGSEINMIIDSCKSIKTTLANI